jgi:hypothetical protein
MLRIARVSSKIPLPLYAFIVVAGYLLLLWARPHVPVQRSFALTVYALQIALSIGWSVEHLDLQYRNRTGLVWPAMLALAPICTTVASMVDGRFMTFPSSVPWQVSEGRVWLTFAADLVYFALVCPMAHGRGAGVLLSDESLSDAETSGEGEDQVADS